MSTTTTMAGPTRTPWRGGYTQYITLTPGVKDTRDRAQSRPAERASRGELIHSGSAFVTASSAQSGAVFSSGRPNLALSRRSVYPWHFILPLNEAVTTTTTTSVSFSCYHGGQGPFAPQGTAESPVTSGLEERSQE